MGRIVFASFRPKPGKEQELLAVIADRLPLLRSLGLATDRPNITVRAADGLIIDVSEWVDDAAIERASTDKTTGSRVISSFDLACNPSYTPSGGGFR